MATRFSMWLIDGEVRAVEDTHGDFVLSAEYDSEGMRRVMDLCEIANMLPESENETHHTPLITVVRKRAEEAKRRLEKLQDAD